ncbi:MAG: hypothetical protein WC412_02095 [Candidatus Omnitrophota bacterium]|jgi:hypothetical protein
MAIIKKEDVIAYSIPYSTGDELSCPDCVGDDLEDVIPLTEYDFEDDEIVVCDRCGKKISY